MKVEDLRRCLKTVANLNMHDYWDGSSESHTTKALVGVMLELHKANKQQAEMNTKLVSALNGIKKELDYIGRSIQDK